MTVDLLRAVAKQSDVVEGMTIPGIGERLKRPGQRFRCVGLVGYHDEKCFP